MSPREFDQLVEASMDVIPPRFRARLRNVVFVVEPEPPSPGLLGLYEGSPQTIRSFSDPIRMPDRITIYQGPHERMARSAADLRNLIQETIWHEVAHYFGLEEREVLQAERRRRERIRRIRRM